MGAYVIVGCLEVPPQIRGATGCTLFMFTVQKAANCKNRCMSFSGAVPHILRAVRLREPAVHNSLIQFIFLSNSSRRGLQIARIACETLIISCRGSLVGLLFVLLYRAEGACPNRAPTAATLGDCSAQFVRRLEDSIRGGI